MCNPATRSGRFFPEYVKGERTNLVDQIRGQVNDKRTYAAIRLIGEMCRAEAYGVGRLGSEQEAKKTFPGRLHKRYCALLNSAQLELFYCGSAELARVEHALLAAFSALPRADVLEAVQTMPHSGAGEARYVSEEMDVTQGKLAIGFSCQSRDYPALLLFNMIYGGSATSKLFLNVREKESLCYYASSVLHRQKDIITLSSGIEVENYERAFDEIMAQLSAAQRGEIEDWEENGARSTMRHVLRTMGDSMSQLEDFYLGQAVTGTTDTVESLAADLDAVTRGAHAGSGCRHPAGYCVFPAQFPRRGAEAGREGGSAVKETHYPKLEERIFRQTCDNGLRLFVVPKRGFAKNYAFFRYKLRQYGYALLPERGMEGNACRRGPLS